jgi:protoporphyrinogen oxidase
MARLYAKGQVKVQSAKSDKKKAPKRIVKSTATAETTKKVVKTAKAQEPMKRLQKSGSVDDAADAFMARWSSNDDE